MRKAMFVLAAAVVGLGAATDASAFCGFYVGGADTKLYNNATQVALMREGTRTVLSMQNEYEGPPQGFAMVVPVPVVLQKENVKTLSRDLFEHLDKLSAPRLVEYWEENPCAHHAARHGGLAGIGGGSAAGASNAVAERERDLGVKVEARFAVGEYEIVILSAKDSGGLETWLHQEGYKIPDGAEPYLRPYVQAGSKFFVAKVDVTKVTIENGKAMLSPLRFHYDSDTFSLPIRLGLMNSGGTQDLIVHILAKGQRYEVANYPNVTIPTNFDVAEGARAQYPAFYAALFDRALTKTPKAVVTEYAWDAGTCDPCPGPPLRPEELATLGLDAFPESERTVARRGRNGFVITRLHARYAKDSLGEDLVFRAAPPISGGREMRDDKGALEHGFTSSTVNNFQGRYAIRHPWAGAITCADPIRGQWGGPPNGYAPAPRSATDLAFAPRGKLQLATIVRGQVPDAIALPGAIVPLGSPVVPVPASVDPIPTATTSATPPTGPEGGAPDAGGGLPATPAPPSRGCGCDVPGATPSTLAGCAAALAAILAWRRRRAR